ncbi:phospholipase D-like domain-containing protein [Verrucomicrobiaceae bacterium 227]
MRKRNNNSQISVHAIAGTEVVLLGLDATETGREGLLGFTIYKKKGAKGKERPLGAGKIFKGIHPEGKRQSIASDKAPIQTFMWSDYEADANTDYTYRVVPVYGSPENLEPGKGVTVKIRTEDPDGQKHAIFFNRGVAGSQAYSRKFKKYRKFYKSEGRWEEFVKPDDVPNNEAKKWLSRGLEEAMLAYLAQATGPEYSIRASLYELTHLPVLEAFIEALERGVDVKIIHHAKQQRVLKLKQNYQTKVVITNKEGTEELGSYANREVLDEKTNDSVAQEAAETIARAGLRDPAHIEAFEKMFIERTDTQITHNKFIILLKNNHPLQVWTGSTNITAGGIYGQSNVGHIVRDEEVASKYHAYWEKLSTDPKKKSGKNDAPDAGIKNWTVLNQPDLKAGPPPPNSITPIFSPRLTTAMLEWYAQLIPKAKNSVHFTAAFTVANQIFEKVTKKQRTKRGEPYLRYLLLEGISGLMKKKYPEMAKIPQNRIAWGDLLKTPGGGEQLIETLTGLNGHVNYLHTKYMLIDPLTDDPIVITGSANFSDASTVNNDENLLIIRGDTRVADIFLGEFMRLFNHFGARNRANRRKEEDAKASRYLFADDSWTGVHFEEGSQLCEERLLFK